MGSLLILFLQALTGFVALVLPCVAGVVRLASGAKDSRAVEDAVWFLQYFVLLCTVLQVLAFGPVAFVDGLLPPLLRQLLHLGVALALAMPSLKVVPRVYGCVVGRHEESLEKIVRCAEEKVVKPLREHLAKAAASAQSD